MPFIPHTEQELYAMLQYIGVDHIDNLFDEIPDALKIKELQGVPDSINEWAITQLMHDFANRDGAPKCYIGAGAYEHHIPAAVWQLTTRGEYYSAYTPYQAEASQGTLQLIYEYQTMMAGLTAMDVSNASLYDGASALSEAILMAVRANRSTKSKNILIANTVNSVYKSCAESITSSQNIKLLPIEYSSEKGVIESSILEGIGSQDIAAVVIQQPNFFGGLEDVDFITNWAHQNNALVIAVVNPMTLAVLKPPGEWGDTGADIVCGDGQPLGVPLSSGGPYYGFICCKQDYVRQMPGRIVGRTVDSDNQPGYVLTLQAREQHIRRSKATSNICTNQGLVVTASTIYMSIMGPEGLHSVAAKSHENTQALLQKLVTIPGVEQVFEHTCFHEAVIKVSKPAEWVLEQLAEHNILGGYNLKQAYPELGEAILICATETKTEEDIQYYKDTLMKILNTNNQL